MHYEPRGRGQFYTPFHMRVDPMERLLLINWKDGRHYKGAEPQWFDDEVHGRGLLVIMYRVDNKVDVYHEPQLQLDAEGYEIQSGLGEMVACEFARSRFEIGAHGVDADIAFVDKAGRPMVLRVRETRGKRAGDFALLAPMGTSIDEPRAMPLLFLYRFSFVKVRGTDMSVTIDGEVQKLLRMPVPMGGSRVYMTRYCDDPFIAFWNPEMNGALPGVAAKDAGNVVVDGVCYALAVQDESLAIAEMVRGQQGSDRRPGREIRVTFDPPFPDIRALDKGASLQGDFRVQMAPSPEAGVVTGQWEAMREGQEVRLRLRPSGGWKSGERSLTPRIIFMVARPFTQWPKSYEWRATVYLSGPQPVMKSGWERV